MTQPPRVAARVPWLDGVRGAAALFVVLHHTWLAAFQHFPENRGPWWLGWAVYGHLAVAVFIVVSGFSLGLAPARRGGSLSGGTGTFLRRRAWRILPPYWAALVLSMVIVVLLTGPRTGATVTAKTALVYGTLVQDVIGAPVPNGVFWSIAIEWQIYFLFPLILWLGRRYGLRLAVGVTLVAAVLAHAAAQTVPHLARLDQLLPQFLGLFVLGVVAARATVSPPTPLVRRLLMLGAAALAGTFVALAATVGPTWVTGHFFGIDLLVGGAAAGLLALMAAGAARPARQVFGSRPLLFLGLFSYSIYLVHAPLLETVWLYAVQPLKLAPLAAYGVLLATVPVVLAGCYLFFRVFEAPFLERRSFGALRSAAVRRLRPGRGGFVPDAVALPGGVPGAGGADVAVAEQLAAAD